MTNKLTVEQCDRDAAATFLGYKDWGDACDYRLTGKQERQRDALVQAFARHRQQAEARAEGLEKAARDILPYLKWTISPESPGYHPTMPSAVGAFDDALTAYRGARP